MNSLLRFVARVVFGKLLPRVAYPVTLGPLRGARFILGAMSGEAGGASVYFNMVEPEQTAILVSTLNAGQVFFDIGANVGYYTVLGSRLVGVTGTVIAFEPVVRNLVYLYQHTLLNRTRNVIIIPSACSERTSLAAFSVGRNFAMGHLAEKSGKKDTFPVPAITVDEVIEQGGVYPDVIKIDVEGGELSVLKGAQAALRTARPRILLSTHSETLREACLCFVKELGFSYEVLSQDKMNPSEFLVYYAAK